MEDELVRIKYIQKKFSVSESTVFKYIKCNIIPRGVRISHRMTVWLKSDIDNAFLQYCIKHKIINMN